jgi:hypothetical protein
MPSVHYNPSTGAVAFNPVTGKVQMVASSCPSCPCSYSNARPDCFPENETPENLYIKINSGGPEAYNGIHCVSRTGSGPWEGFFAADAIDYYLRLEYSYGETVVALLSEGSDIWAASVLAGCAKVTLGANRGYAGQAVTIDPCVMGDDATVWEYPVSYAVGNEVKLSSADAVFYICYASHLSSLANKPVTGENWLNYWEAVDC